MILLLNRPLSREYQEDGISDWGDPPDAVTLSKPQVPVGTRGDTGGGGITGGDGELRDNACGRHSPDRVAILLCEPQVAVRPGGDAPTPS